MRTRTRSASCSGSSLTTRFATRALMWRCSCRPCRDGLCSWSRTTVPASPWKSASASSRAFTGLPRRVRERMQVWVFRSRGGSSSSTGVASWWAPPTVGAPPFSSTFHSYRLLKQGRHDRGMFDIAPDHAIGLYTGLLALPLALVAIRLRPARRRVPGTVLGASVLLAMSGAVHLALISTHVSEPLTSWLFLANGTGYLALSF